MSLEVFLDITSCHLVTSFQSTRRNFSENFNNQAITVRSLFRGAVRNFCYAMPYMKIRSSASGTCMLQPHSTNDIWQSLWSTPSALSVVRLNTGLDGRCVCSVCYELHVSLGSFVLPRRYWVYSECFTYESTYLRTTLKRNDNSAIHFPVSGSLLYHMQARSVIVKMRRACSRTKIKSATNSRTQDRKSVTTRLGCDLQLTIFAGQL